MLIINQIICALLICLCAAQSFPRDLRQVQLDISNPKLRDIYPLGVVHDIYVHFDIDPTLFESPNIQGEQQLIDYILSLVDVWNQHAYNPANMNLVASSFSIAANPTDSSYLSNCRNNKPLREGEHHIWAHFTNNYPASVATRFGLYRGEDRSYAIITAFAGRGFGHSDRGHGPHEIGHLFGLEHSDMLQREYGEVSISPDYCRGNPYTPGRDCASKPELGGTLMSYCHMCPGAEPLSQFHPFQIAKMQEHFASHGGESLPAISWPKLRNYIPSQASANRCASEGQNCNCNGVVYYGPTISSSSIKIFAIAQVSGSVRCDGGRDQEFPDVLHRSSKSCYCHGGADLMDVSYLPTSVEFTSEGMGKCDFPCGRYGCAVIVFGGQPEWKCKQECLGERTCLGYNFKNGFCRYVQTQLLWPIPEDSGDFSGSTCWKRPEADATKWPQPQHVERPANSNPRPTTQRPTTSTTTQRSEDCQNPAWIPLEPSECPSDNGRFLPECTSDMEVGDLCEADSALPDGTQLYNINNCADYDVFRYQCGASPPQECDDPVWVPIQQSECPSDNGARLPECTLDMEVGDLCEADRHLPDGTTRYNINNCPGGYDVFRFQCGASTTSTTTTPRPTWGQWGSWSSCSATCGDGTQRRERTCSSSGCTGSSSESQVCNLRQCPSNDACENPTWVAISPSDCPSEGVSRLPECTSDMDIGDLCEADRPLPDGTRQYNVNNCPGGYDVFRYQCDAPSTDGCSWTAIPSNECPSGNGASLPECTENMQSGDLCEADSALPDGSTNYNVNNCGSYDVFRYSCGSTPGTTTTTVRPDLTFQNLGDGYCTDSNGERVAGMGSSQKYASECRSQCERRSDCWGYTAVLTGRSGTCYVHGDYSRSDISGTGWYITSATVHGITQSSGHPNIACYKRM